MYVCHLQENVSLLKEINDLRSELKKSRTHCHDLEAAVNIARKQGFDDQAAIATAKPIVPPTGLAKVEAPADHSRIVELQRVEISRLRAKIMELEGLRRPHSGTKLPPMHATVTVQP